MYEYGQRYYAPWLCRFVTVDPSAEDYPQLSSYNNVVQTINKFDTAGNQLYTNHIDRGIARLTVDAKGMPYFTMDAKGAVTLSLYDDLDRPIKMWARDIETESISIRNQTVYGDGAGLTNPENQNLKGKPYQVYDGAGRLTFNAYDFKGNLLEKTRKVIKDNFLIGKSKYEVAWGTLDTSKLGSSNFKTNTVYDALNRAIEVTYPQDKSGGRKKLHPEYNKAGALEKLQFNGATALSQLAYNAKGQRTMMVAAGLMTRYAYDEETFRLTRIRAEKFSKSGVNYGPNSTPSVRLDRGYSYDLMGSVTGVHDKTPGDSNSFGPVDKQWVYSHDPLRRLISATGREHTHASYSTPWQDIDFPNSSDITATNDYVREYAYDKQGNILRLKHTAVGHTGNGFTRYFNKTTGYTTDNLLNTLTEGDSPNEVNFTYSYDANGNMIQENTDRYFEWNYADKLAFFKRQAGTSDPTVWVHYLYDNEGNRVKKFVNKTGGVREVTIYIDGIYEYTYRIVGTAVQANHDFNTLHIMDGSSRIATVRVGNHAADQSPTQKYFVEGHLGNASVVVKTNGDQVNLEEYFPFGETSFGSYAKKRYRYNGKEKDEHTGLYEYGQRYYAPWLCRFVSVDPIAEDYPQLSSYNYAGNKPITARDIDGLQSSVDQEGGGSSTNLSDSLQTLEQTGDSIATPTTLEVHGNPPLELTQLNSEGDPKKEKKRGLYVGNIFESTKELKALVLDGNRSRISVSQKGEVEIDISGMTDKQLKKDKGLKLLSDIDSSDKSTLFEAGEISFINQNNKDIPAAISFEENGLVNLSRYGKDSSDGYRELPSQDFDGQVSISAEGQFLDRNGNDIKTSIIFHELAENYYRTHYGYDYNANDSNNNRGADKRAEDREGNHYWNRTPGQARFIRPSYTKTQSNMIQFILSYFNKL